MQVRCLLTDASRSRVRGVLATPCSTPCSTLARPKPRRYSTSPWRAMATTSPGASLRRAGSKMASSMACRLVAWLMLLPRRRAARPAWAFPPRETQPLTLYLDSDGRANSARGDGRLLRQPPAAASPPDRFVDDPTLPFVAALATAREPDGRFDLRERERQHETLVYDSGLLTEPLTLLGEGEAVLFVAADAPDADLVLWLAEHRADRQTVKLSFGQLRLRYRHGFDREQPLTLANRSA